MQTSFRLVGIAVGLLALGALATPDARGNYLAFAPPSSSFSPSPGAANDPVNLALIFNVTSSVTADQLGFYDIANLIGPETVMLYDSAGNSLASAVVSVTDPMTGGYFMHSITPVVLAPGQYVLEAFTGNNSWDYTSSATVVSGAGITFGHDNYAYGSTPIFTGTGNAIFAAASYYGPTFDIESGQSSVPEPGTWLLIATGLGLVGFARGRVRR